MGREWMTRAAWWWIQRQKPAQYGVWMPVPDGYDVRIIEKTPSSGTLDPFEAYRTVGIKLTPTQKRHRTGRTGGG